MKRIQHGFNKKIVFLLSTVLFVFVSSCSNKEDDIVKINANIETGADSKIHLNHNLTSNHYSIGWDLNDQMTLASFTGDLTSWYNNATAQSVSNNGRNATFICEDYNGMDYGVAGCDVTIHLPNDPNAGDDYSWDVWSIDHAQYILYSTYTYKEGQIPMPMVGRYYLGEELFFRNLCGVLRITLKNDNSDINIKRIKLTARGHFLSGSVSDITNQYDNVSLYTAHENSNTGVSLGNNGKDFYFPIPANTINNLIIEITNMNDETAIKDLSDHTIEVRRSQLTGIKVDMTNCPYN